ncbi:MAG: MFS transporter [archaeon]|nr:MFS transporter [archaeon]
MKEIGDPTSSRWSSFLTRDGKLILLQVLLNSIPLGYMNVIPAVYLLELGYSASVVGAIYAASAFSNTVGLTPFGFLADRFGRKIFFLIGSFVPAISYVIFALTTNAYWLIVASVIGGVGVAGGIAVAISGPALLPLLANATSDKNRTTLFGATQGAWAIALTIGSLLSYLPGFFMRYLSQSSLSAHAISYYAMATLAAASAIPVLFIKEGKKQKERKQIGEEAAETAPITQRRTAVSWILDLPKSTRKIPLASTGITAKFSIVYALSGLGLGVIVQLLASWYYLQFGIPESTAGLWIGIAEVGSIPTIFMIPWLVRRRGTLNIAVAFLAISALFLGFMPLSGVFILAAIFFVARNIFVNISWPVMQSYMMGIVAEKERATITGIATTAWGLANAVGTLIGGSLLASGMLYLPFVIGVAGYIGSSIALWIFFRRVKPPEEMNPTQTN